MIQFNPLKWIACLFLFLLPIMLGICCPYSANGGSQGYGWCPTCGTDMPDSHFPHGGGGGGGGGYGGYTPGPSPQEQQANAANREGLSYEKSGDWDNAIKSYREASRLNPNEIVFLQNLQDAINNKGVVLHNNGDYEGALRLYEEALSLNPDYPNGRRNIRVAKGHILNRKGLDYFEIEDYDSAIRYLEESIKINPEDQTARGNLAEARKRKREQVESIQLEDQWRKDEQRRKEEERIAREKEEQKRKEEERIAKEIEDKKRKEEERITKEVQEQKRIEEERIAKAIAEQKLKEATQRVNNMLDGLAKKLGASPGTTKSSNSSGLRLMRPAGTRLFEKGTKSSAPVDLRLMPLYKPLVGNTKDVKGVSPTPQIAKSKLSDTSNKVSDKSQPRGLSLLEAIKDKKRGPVVKAMVYRTLALTAASQGDHDEAVNLLKKALVEVPDNKGLQDALKYELYARDKNNEEVISNPKVDVLLEALGPGKTWDESISYLEDKLVKEQDAKKKLAIRDALADAKKAAATDNRRQYDKHMQKVDEFLKKENKDSTLSGEEFLDILESSVED